MSNLYGHKLAAESNSTIDDFVAFHVGAILQRARADARAEAAMDRTGTSWADEVAGGNQGNCVVVLEQMSFTEEAAKYL